MRMHSAGLIGIALAGLTLAMAIAWPSIADEAARRVESRLRAQTGLAWRVESARLAFRPVPQLVLHHVALGDDRTGSTLSSARIETLRIQDPLALIFGSGERFTAVGEGLVLRSRLRGGHETDKSAIGRPALKPSSIRATLHGAEAGLAEAGRTFSASARSFELAVAPAPAEDGTRIDLSVELPNADLHLVASKPDTAGAPLDFVLEPRKPDGHRIEASAKVSLAASDLRLEPVKGSIDGTPFGGRFGLDWGGAKPRFSLDAKLDALTLIGEEAAMPRGTGFVVRVTPEMIPDARWFADIEGDGRLDVARLRLGSVQLQAGEFSARLAGGTLETRLASASGYDGTARGRYALTPEGEGPGRHHLDLTLERMRVLPLLGDLAGIRGVDGTGALRVALQATGRQIPALRDSLSGTADLAVLDGQVDGLDLAGAFGLIRGEGSKRGALATRLDRFAGHFTLGAGQAVTNDLDLETGLIAATGIGSFDLVGRTLDLRLNPRIVPAQGRRRSETRNLLDVPVRIFGPWSDPSVRADVSGAADRIAKNPSGLFDTLRDLGENLLGEEGLDLGGVLDAILPRRGDGEAEPPPRRSPR